MTRLGVERAIRQDRGDRRIGEASAPSAGLALDYRLLYAYTCNMNAEKSKQYDSGCLCNALRRASRAVSRLFDEELRHVGLRMTRYSLLSVLARSGQVRQGELSGPTSLDQTTLSRDLRPLVAAGWVSVRSGNDRREKLVAVTAAGTAKLAEARPAWERAQGRMRALLPVGTRRRLLAILTEIAKPTGEN
jgi:DNA-binding MarR family transcriptional regulator